IELLLNGLYRRIRSRPRRSWCREGTRGRAAGESADALSLKLTPVWLYVAARAFQSPTSVAETTAAAVVVSHHGIESIHIRIAVAIDAGLFCIHADVFGQAVPNLLCRKHEVLLDGRSCLSRPRRRLWACGRCRIGGRCALCSRRIGGCRAGGALVCLTEQPDHP